MAPRESLVRGLCFATAEPLAHPGSRIQRNLHHCKNMTIRNVYYEITSFHTNGRRYPCIKGQKENTERLRFYDNREGNLEEISTLLRAGKVPKSRISQFLCIRAKGAESYIY